MEKNNLGNEEATKFSIDGQIAPSDSNSQSAEQAEAAQAEEHATDVAQAEASEDAAQNAKQGEAEADKSSLSEEHGETEVGDAGQIAENAAGTGALTLSRREAFFAAIKQKLSAFKSPKFSAAYIAKIAILTAISFVLYAFGKFNMPSVFPVFLEVQISELPALLAGFAMGPVSGAIVIILKCLLKLPLSSTFYVGELTDIILGLAFVIPASVIYRVRRDKSRKSGIIHAIIGLAAGSAILTAASLLVNRFISAPFYIEMYFNGNLQGLVDMLAPLYKDITQQTFYAYYLFAGVLPFNLFRCIIVSLLTFFLYKRLSTVLHWEGTSLIKKKKSDDVADEGYLSGSFLTSDVQQTYELAYRLADTLDGGEIILLNGELGAGKTTFTKGLAKALGVTSEVTSPTFTLLNVYEEGRLKLNHIDMYRAQTEDELYELGLSDVMDDASVTVIEWNKFSDLKGKIYTINVSSVDDNSRQFDISFENKTE